MGHGILIEGLRQDRTRESKIAIDFMLSMISACFLMIGRVVEVKRQPCSKQDLLGVVRTGNYINLLVSSFSKEETVKLDARSNNTGALLRASQKPTQPNNKTPKTLLVYPFTQTRNEDAVKSRSYLLETPKDLKRKKPLLQIPGDSKKPKLYTEISNESEIETSNSHIEMKSVCQDTNLSKSCQSHTQTDTTVKGCHCCCRSEKREAKVTEASCHCQSQPVKVIFAPAMMPSIFGPVPGIPYIVKPPAKSNEKVSFC
ncbi:hypothetical protein ACJJTC_008680 [Scirpophaga incertulas]